VFASVAAGPAPPLPPSDHYIKEQIDRTREQIKLVELSTQLLLGTLLGIGYLLFLVLVDHWAVEGGLGDIGRLFACVSLVAGGVIFLAWKVLPLLLRQINPVYAAATIEQGTPNLKSSLINFLLLRREQSQLPEPVYEVIQQRAASDLARVSVDSVVDNSRLLRLGYVLIAAVAILGLYKLVSPKDPLSSLGRVVFPWMDIPVPTRVTIQSVEPGDGLLYTGDHARVTAQVRGLSSGEPVLLHWWTLDGAVAPEPIPLDYAADSLRHGGELPGTAEGLTQDVQYQLQAGDFRTPIYKLNVRPTPSLTVDRVRLEYPTYTGLTPEDAPVGDVVAPEGTRVTIFATANQEVDPRSPHLVFNGNERLSPVRLKVIDNDKRQLTGSFRLNLRSDGRPEYENYLVRFRNALGRENTDPIRYHLRTVPDKAPEVRFTAPAQHVDVAVDGQVPLVIECQDDYGLGRVTLHVTRAGVDVLGNAGQELLKEPSREPEPLTFALSPFAVGARPGDSLFYWAEVEDQKTPQPNRVKSTVWRVTVLAPEQKATPPRTPDQVARNDQPQTGTEPNPQPNGVPQNPAENPGAMPPGAEKKEPGPATKEAGQRPENPTDPAAQDPAGQNSAAQNPPAQSPENATNSRGSEKIDPELDAGRAFEEILKTLDKKDQPGQESPNKEEPAGKEPPQGPDQEKTEPQSSPSPQSGSQNGSEKNSGEKSSGQQGSSEKSAGQQSSGSQSSGSQSSGEKSSGSQNSGSQSSGQNSGEKNSGSQSSGNQSSGNQSSGSQSAGEKSPNSSGQNSGSSTDNNPSNSAGQPNSSGQKNSSGQPQPGQANSGQGGSEQSPMSAQNAGEQKSGDQKSGDPNAQNAQKTSSSGPNSSGENSTSENPSGQESTSPQPGQKNGSSPANAKPMPGQESGSENASEGKVPPGAEPSRVEPGQPGQKNGAQNSIPSSAGQTGEKTESGTSGNDSKSPGNKQPQPNPQPGQSGTNPQTPDQAGQNPGAKGQGDTALNNGSKSEASKNPQTADNATGGDPLDTKGDPGSGAGGQESKGSPSSDSQGMNNDRKKQEGLGGEKNTGNQPQGASPGVNDKESDGKTKGQEDGSVAGGGGEGGGEAAKNPGTGGAGSNTASQQGASQAPGPGQGETGQKAGNSALSETPTGQPGSETPGQGSGSKASSSGQQPGGKGPGETSAAPPKSGEGQPQGGSSGAGSPVRGGNASLPGGNALGSDGSQNPGGDDANLEYSQKATDLVLEQLKDQIDQNKVDPQLLDRLGWSRTDLERFVDRWRKLRQDAKTPGAEGAEARRLWEERVRGLGLNQTRTEVEGIRDAVDQAGPLLEGATLPPPPSRYRSQRDAYQRSISRGAPGQKSP